MNSTAVTGVQNVKISETPPPKALETSTKSFDLPDDEFDTIPKNPEFICILDTPSKPIPITSSKTELGADTLSMPIQEILLETLSKTVPFVEQTPMDVSLSNQKTPSKTVPVVDQEPMDVSLSNEKTPANTTPVNQDAMVPATNEETPSKTTPVNQDALVPAKNEATPSQNSSVHQDAMVPVTPLKTVVSNTITLENGIADTVQDTPKWGGAVHRKSDGKPIDTFGVKKDVWETTTLTVKPSVKNTSIISLHDDSSDEDGPRNEFIDDEAMESNGELSMDEDERKYLEENEIPEDGISLGSDTDVDEISDSNASKDSFIVSDSSVQLLDGSGDDLEIDNSKNNTSQNKSMRGNKIFDTSDDELVLDPEPRKSLKSKKRSDTSMDSPAIAKRSSVSIHETVLNSSTIDENSEEDVAVVLANLDDEPKRTTRSKRLSDLKSLPKKDDKRMSLHPNAKLNESSKKVPISVDESSSDERVTTSIDESNEDDVTEVLANLDAEPKRVTRSKRLSDSMSLSKKDMKRMSLHPNTKLNSSGLVEEQQKSILIKNVPVIVDESSVEDVTDELANIDAEPKKTTVSKRLSDAMSLSKKDMKRLSVHPNAKLNRGGLNAEQQKSALSEKDPTPVDESSEEDVTKELAKLDAEPKKTIISKRLSESMTLSKKDLKKRLSLHPSTKLNNSGLNSQDKPINSMKTENTESTLVPQVNSDQLNGIEKMDIEQSNDPADSVPSTSQVAVKFNFEEIQAKCDAMLNLANEAKREDKLKNKVELQVRYFFIVL